MYQGFLTGFRDKKAQVIDSVTNATEKIKQDLLMSGGIQYKKDKEGVPDLMMSFRNQ